MRNFISCTRPQSQQANKYFFMFGCTQRENPRGPTARSLRNLLVECFTQILVLAIGAIGACGTCGRLMMVSGVAYRFIITA